MDYLFLLLGLFLLIFSGEKLVKSAVSLAKYFRVSDLIIGATIVSIGTSAPELFVSATASFNGFPEIATGNIIGSNIANIGFVLAICGIIVNINFPKNFFKRDLMILLFCTFIFVLFLSDYTIKRFEGIILLILFVSFIYFNIRVSKNITDSFISQIDVEDEYKSTLQKPLISVLIILLSSLGLMYGSELMVNSSVNIAKSFGITERVIAVSMVAIGTSLPELVTSVIAVLKKNTSIIIGNLIGSNIINILLIGGVSAVIAPIKVSYNSFHIDALVMVFFVVLLIGILFLYSKYNLSLIKSLIILLFYFAFIGLLV